MVVIIGARGGLCSHTIASWNLVCTGAERIGVLFARNGVGRVNSLLAAQRSTPLFNESHSLSHPARPSPIPTYDTWVKYLVLLDFDIALARSEI